MRRLATLFSLLVAVMACSIQALAQTAKPTFIYQKFSDYAIASALSDNGKWAIVKGATNEQLANGYIRLLNMETEKYMVVRTDDEDDEDAMGEYQVCDVTDDGNILVGAFDGNFTSDGYYTGKPGYWTKSTMTWTELPMPAGFASAVVSCVTPDGKYAVGTAESDTSSPWTSVSEGVLWDLTTGEILSTPGKPVMEMDKTEKGEAYPQQEAFTQISADGRYIAIYGNQSYAPISYVYDRQTETYFKFGKTGTGENAPSDFLQMEGGVVISGNGKYVAGTIRTNEDELFPLVLNMETKTYTYFNTVEENDLMVDGIDNEGNVYAASPSTNPVREWQIMTGNVWYPFSKILKQRYGIDYTDYTGFDNTGTLWSASNDGMTLCSMVSPQGESYIVKMPESITEACNGIDLLKDYTASPASGSEFAWVETIELTFNNDIVVNGNKKSAVLKDKDGKTLRNSMIFALKGTSNRTLEVTFRATQMTAGEDYTVEIPAGAISLAKNPDKTNSLITINYKGRADEPINIVTAFPADGAEIARIDNSSIPVYLTPDTKVLVSDKASASLIQVDGDNEKTICSLSVVASNDNSMVALVPSATQYLYNGGFYKVVLAAGSLTDMSGSEETGNKELVLNYTGTYERQISTDDATLFSNDFTDISTSLKNFIRYEGDHRTPVEAMQKWEFDADNQPWNFSIRESSSSTKYYACSHSMYTPAGQSDDWMIIPQLTIPDAYTTLTFKAQSYLDDKHDTLRIVVWPQDENISYFGDERIAKMKAEGDVTAFELNIGETEDGLDGEFTDYKVDLGKYAGKKVYIGFWNNNTDQSAIFVDSVMVRRNLKYLMSLNNASSVVAKNEVAISGTLTANSDDDVYHSMTLTLKDAEGNVIDTYSKEGLEMKKGDKEKFAFTKPLPLTIGDINSYSITVQLDDYTDVTKSTIKDLSFEPVKRVALEEMTGFTCQYCPEGLVAIEHLKQLYGDQFIPLSIHTYTGDPYGTGLSGYTSYLGLSGAPTAIIQRDGVISAPLAQDDEGDYTFNYGGKLWSDKVAEELNKPTELGVSVPKITYDETTNKLNVTLQLKSALNMKNQYINVFGVAMEDKIVYTQENALRVQTDPIFGEWGKGGKYAYASVPNVSEDDVVRSYWGTSFSGSNVGFPQVFEAGQEYSVTLDLSYPDQIYVKENGKIAFMVFDGNTNSLINTVLVKMTDIVPTGIQDTAADNASLCISSENGKVVVKGVGETTAQVYTVAGMLLGTATSNGVVNVPTKGYHGAVIVKATCGNTSATKKIVVD